MILLIDLFTGNIRFKFIFFLLHVKVGYVIHPTSALH